MAEVDPQRAGAGLILVTGPTRSGKSRWAESLVADQAAVIYMATGPSRPEDQQWQQRLQRHRQRRASHWSTVECANDFCEALARVPGPATLLVDSLGGIVANQLESSNEAWDEHQEQLIKALMRHQGIVVIVIEETGWGVVPSTAIGGLFRDRLGSLAQVLEALASQSWLVVQGRALNLSQLGKPVP